jgi:beta-lactamase family protein
MIACLRGRTAVMCAFTLLLFSHGAVAVTLDESLDAIAPNVKKWATVCVISNRPDGTPQFAWCDYRESGQARDFWPASAIKLYAGVAALELLNDRKFPLDTAVLFEHREPDGTWTLDCARSMREMLSEVFRRSSNEDYTLLLRMVGIDRINTHFLVPEKGFPHSALMRGYVLGRPYGYVREEPQRITLRASDGRSDTIEHVWSGRSYAAERGATIIDAQTGNVTSPRELAECLRRVLFHEQLPAGEQFQLTSEQLNFIRHGGRGLYGLENKNAASDPIGWKDGVQSAFPKARYFHKTGVISNFALEVAAVDDRADSGRYFIFVPVVAAGSETKPESGQTLIGKMSRAIAEWVRDSVSQCEAEFQSASSGHSKS